MKKRVIKHVSRIAEVFEVIKKFYVKKEKFMENMYYILMPIISSALGGLIGGLFTYLGVRMTIKNDNKLKKQEICEQNKEKNKQVVANRPEFKVVENKNAKSEAEIYVLPYIEPKLISQEQIYFNYDKLKLNDDFWGCKEVVICNCGKTTIETGFLELEYKSGVNIYSKYELAAWKQMPWMKNYYSDMQTLPSWIHPNECVKLKIYYPKKIKQLADITFNCYMIDEDGNTWFQDVVNLKTDGNKSTYVSPQAYTLHYRDQYYKWFIYDILFYSKDIEKCFDTTGFEAILKQRKEKLWTQDEKNEKFKQAVYNGEILLETK